MPERAKQAIETARADLARRTGVAPAMITLARVEAVDWRDSSLGCPQPGQMYLQVITPGYLILLEAAGRTYEYHTDREGRHVVLCQQSA